MDISINNIWSGLLVLPLGFVLGIFYFSCLWLTVQNLTRTRHPLLLIVGSGVVRLTVALFAFYWLIGGHWERLLFALGGFLLARGLLIARWRPQTALTDGTWEDGHGNQS